MIIENDKIYLNRSLISMSADINIKKETVYAEIIAWLFRNEAMLYGRVNIDDVLFISDTDANNINIMPDNFNGIPDWLDNTYLTYPMPVNSINAHVFNNLEKIPDIINLIRTKYKVIVIGFINNISINAFNNILYLLRGTSNIVIVFGDELIDSIENKNYHRAYLSNNNLTLKLEYADNRVSPSKKLNGAIARMRKAVDMNNIASTSIHLTINNIISSNDIINIMNSKTIADSYQIIVPKSLYHDIISDCYNRLYNNDDVFLKIFRNYYLKMPYLYINNDNNSIPKYIYLDSMTCVTVTNIHYMSNLGYKIVVCCDLNVANGNYAGIYLNNVIIDFNSYIWNFNPDKHIIDPEVINISLVNYALNEENTWDASLCQLCPFPICTYETAKYAYIDDNYAFIETLETIDINKPATDLYQMFCKTKNNIFIYQSDIFNYI